MFEFKLAAVRVVDMVPRTPRHCSDPFNRDTALYHTWQLLQPPSNGSSSHLVRQGFSTRGGVCGATVMRRGDRFDAYADPLIRFDVPAATSKPLRIDIAVNHWEHAELGDTRSVKTLFTDGAVFHLASLAKVLDLLEAADGDSLDELGASFERALRTGIDIATFAGGGNWLTLAGKTVPQLLGVIVKVAKSLRREELHWHEDVFVFEARRAGSDVQWRLLAPADDDASSSGWQSGAGEAEATRTVVAPDRKGRLELTYRARML